MGKLTGRSALVSGGASGIGNAIAQLFLEEGASVAISDINGDGLDAAVKDLSGSGTVLGINGDVRSMANAGRMVAETVEAFGAIDVLVCNAGITSVAPIGSYQEEWDAVLTTNVKGMFTLVKHAVPHMIAQGGGNIVTLGSEMGIVAVPESPAYNASKGAVIMFTKSIALDLIRHNIRVNSLCPGITRTPLLQAEVDNSLDPERPQPSRRPGRRSAGRRPGGDRPGACSWPVRPARSPSAAAWCLTAASPRAEHHGHDHRGRPVQSRPRRRPSRQPRPDRGRAAAAPARSPAPRWPAASGYPCPPHTGWSPTSPTSSWSMRKSRRRTAPAGAAAHRLPVP